MKLVEYSHNYESNKFVPKLGIYRDGTGYLKVLDGKNESEVKLSLKKMKLLRDFLNKNIPVIEEELKSQVIAVPSVEALKRIVEHQKAGVPANMTVWREDMSLARKALGMEGD